MELYFRYLLEWMVLIPAAVFTLTPVRKYLKISLVKSILTVSMMILAIAVSGAFLCTAFSLQTNFLLIPVMVVFYVGLHLATDMPVSQRIFCFGNAVMLTTFGTMYTNYLMAPVEAPYELFGSDLPFTFFSSCICLAVDAVIYLIYYRVLTVKLPYLLDEELIVHQWKWLLSVPVALTVLFFWMTPVSAANMMVGRIRIISLVVTPFVPLVCLLFYDVSYGTARRFRQHERTLRENDMLRMEEKRFEEFREYIDRTRTARHDFRQHVLALKRFADEGAYERLNTYLTELTDTTENTAERICAHVAVDAVASYYQREAAEAGVSICYAMQVPEKVPWEDAELAVLYGNLIENAVREAAKTVQIPYDTEVTVVSQLISDNMLGISVENPYTGEVHFDKDGLPKTSRAGHGLGIRSVATTVERHHGTLQITAENGVFNVSVLIYR